MCESDGFGQTNLSCLLALQQSRRGALAQPNEVAQDERTSQDWVQQMIMHRLPQCQFGCELILRDARVVNRVKSSRVERGAMARARLSSLFYDSSM